MTARVWRVEIANNKALDDGFSVGCFTIIADTYFAAAEEAMRRAERFKPNEGMFVRHVAAETVVDGIVTAEGMVAALGDAE